MHLWPPSAPFWRNVRHCVCLVAPNACTSAKTSKCVCPTLTFKAGKNCKKGSSSLLQISKAELFTPFSCDSLHLSLASLLPQFQRRVPSNTYSKNHHDHFHGLCSGLVLVLWNHCLFMGFHYGSPSADSHCRKSSSRWICFHHHQSDWSLGVCTPPPRLLRPRCTGLRL